MSHHLSRRRRVGVAATLTALAVTAGSVAAVVATSTAGGTAAAAGRAGGVQANLWEWNWNSVAAECTNVLGPAGYAGVQVAPPADSLKRTATSPDAPILHPWWEVYQPGSYNLVSRMGTENEFHSMVTTCRRAGVKVYVDAVVNHMTGQGQRTYGGVRYSHLEYPGLYTSGNFHQRGVDCPTATGGIDDFNNYRQVTQCELLGLADLATDDLGTRDIIAGYLNKLIAYGVSGFRVDAAKHVGIEDMKALQKLLHTTADGTRPYVALEVFPDGPGKVSQWAFTEAGSVLGFDYAFQIEKAFRSYNGTGYTGSISSLSVFGEAAGLVPSNKSLVFIQNHDTERDAPDSARTLTYRDGRTNIIANQFMLAYPYGTPQVYSAFSFPVDQTYASPPARADGRITDTDCANGWVCVDRDPGVRGMVKFRNTVANAPLRNWWDDGNNMIAFSRGTAGFFAVNNGTATKNPSIQTSLDPGTYCNIVDGTRSGTTCTGTQVVVDRHGVARLSVPGKTAVAFTTADRVE
ncbi:alpha-amylase [Jatrophihabitans sp. YIM 134969]